MCVLSRFSRANSLQPYGLYPTRLLCPWDSPDKNTGVGCHALLQGIFLTQEEPTSPVAPALQADSLSLSHQGSLKKKKKKTATTSY